MSRSEKKQRKAFLNDLCAKFGITSTDPRRGDASIAFIAYGEIKCRAWLAQAGCSYAGWDKIVDINQARRIVSKNQIRKRKTHRSVSPFATPKRRMKRSLDSRCKVRDHSSRGTVCADGSGNGWRNLSRNEEFSLANRI